MGSTSPGAAAKAQAGNANADHRTNAEQRTLFIDSLSLDCAEPGSPERRIDRPSLRRDCTAISAGWQLARCGATTLVDAHECVSSTAQVSFTPPNPGPIKGKTFHPPPRRLRRGRIETQCP